MERSKAWEKKNRAISNNNKLSGPLDLHSISISTTNKPCLPLYHIYIDLGERQSNPYFSFLDKGNRGKKERTRLNVQHALCISQIQSCKQQPG